MTKFPKLKITFILIFLFGIFGLAKISQAATLYVCPSGCQYSTIQAAADAVNPGDMVIVRDGVYTDTNSDGKMVSIARSGASSAWITFKSENKWGAKLVGLDPATADFQYGIFLAGGASYLKIEDFDISGGNTGIFMSNNQNIHHISILGNYMHDLGREPNDCSGACCADSSLKGGGGIYVGGDADVGGGVIANNFVVDGNRFERIGRFKCSYSPYSAGMWDHGVYISNSAPNEYIYIRNNIFSDILSGYAVQHSYASNHIQVINNTIYESDDWGGSASTMFGISQSDIFMTNNIIYSRKPACVFLYGHSCGSNNVLKNNYCWNLDTGDLYRNYDIDCVSSIAMADNYCNEVTQCGSKVASDPKFVNLASRDFHLQSTSPAINKGLSAGAPSYDFNGVSRPQGGIFDIGAYEYGGGASDTTAPAAPTGLSVR
jgi:hypothetical protein